ncbi:S41 family peptidase [Catenulispora pinisilvae]|uniref:S41 family peptidase n=1 Tax=Catenulispora pinisilvae TaxID=2705253 RepID=UPI001E4EBD81|nr:S41 family peptidase [Catenulispora pinisilvae]
MKRTSARSAPRGRTLCRIGAVTAAAALVAAGAATGAEAKTGTGTGIRTGTPAGLDGAWQMAGYGLVLDVEGATVTAYETTAISCLPEFTGTRTGTAGPGGDTTFAVGTTLFTLRPEQRARALSMTIQESVGLRHLARLAALPARCTQPTPTDPRTVFDIFWQTYQENYPFFAARGIDWQATGARLRAEITPKTTDAQLFQILTDAFAPLNDSHTALSDGTTTVSPSRPGTVSPSRAYDAGIEAFIQAHDLTTPLQEWGRGHIAYADLPGGIGYLRLSSFAGYTSPDDSAGFASDKAELDRALDAIFTPQRTQGPNALRGLIIDDRVNGGGSDVLALDVVSRLTSKPYTAYWKKHRDDPNDPSVFSRPEPIRVTPSDNPIYRGPIALLAGGSTVSAGETFAQALMGRTPAPVRIGENTQGSFSDTLNRTLPNGWEFELPNEEYPTSRNGPSFDITGIPPQIRIPVFPPNELAAGRDTAFTTALAVLEDCSRPNH